MFKIYKFSSGRLYYYNFNSIILFTSRIFIFKFNLDNSFDRHIVCLSWFREGGVLLIGYEMYRNLTTQSTDKDFYRTLFLDPGPSLIVADEGHILKTKDVG
jgi:hypothetical protein